MYKLVEQQTGYNLNVQGSVSISVFPRLNLSADNIILKNKDEILFKSKGLIVYPSILSVRSWYWMNNIKVIKF